jgi:hypothetical protein
MIDNSFESQLVLNKALATRLSGREKGLARGGGFSPGKFAGCAMAIASQIACGLGPDCAGE